MRGQSSAAFGTAMIAALGSDFNSLEDVADAMLAIDATFFPVPEKHAQYSEIYTRFCDLMEEQGYGGTATLHGTRYMKGNSLKVEHKEGS
jgi:sugar (pentulose or hexulose) kinase